MTNAEDRLPSPPARRRGWHATRALRSTAADAASSAEASSPLPASPSAETGPFARPSLLAKFRASFLRLDAGDTDTESMDCDCDALDSPLGGDDPSTTAKRGSLLDADVLIHDSCEEGDAREEVVSLVRALPAEILAIALSHLDGGSLLRCASTCRALRALTYDRDVWRRLCLLEWPTLRSLVLPQLPGAPDYDVRWSVSLPSTSCVGPID